jgi:O-antigen/teichoic acid export membrane protein
MTVSTPTAVEREKSALHARARSGSIWVVTAFGASQVLRLGLNIVLAALLFEEAFALMAIVTAVMIGLSMFSDIGLQQNVVQSPRGDDPAFLNTAWTMQVIRGMSLALVAVILAWPLATFYGVNDPSALELRWLIPLVALTAAIDGLRSPSALSAARHMHVAQLTRIEVVAQVFNAALTASLVWYTRSVYGIALAGVLSSVLHLVLTYWLLPGSRPRFMLEPAAVRSIFSYGKWIFLSTLLAFLALQIDRLTFAAMYPLAEVGVYSIAASLAAVVVALVGRLQSAIVFPWYSRMLEDGMALPEAFNKIKVPVLVMSTYLVTLLIVGAGSFFEWAYDERYVQAKWLLPVLAVGTWFSCLEPMYGAAFLASGRANWVAMASTAKVVSFAVLVVLLSMFQWGLVVAAVMVAASEVAKAGASQLLGRRIGLRNLRMELAMLVLLSSVSGVVLLLVNHVPLIADLHPAVRLMILGLLVSLLYVRLLLRAARPFLKRRKD